MYPNPFIMIYQLIVQTYAIRLKTQSIVGFFLVFFNYSCRLCNNE